MQLTGVARFLFVSPPSMEELEARLRGRGTETEARAVHSPCSHDAVCVIQEKIQVRLENARKELEYTKREGFFDKVLVNDDLEKAYTELKAFVDLGPPKL